jgi:hypothetical protein
MGEWLHEDRASAIPNLRCRVGWRRRTAVESSRSGQGMAENIGYHRLSCATRDRQAIRPPVRPHCNGAGRIPARSNIRSLVQALCPKAELVWIHPSACDTEDVTQAGYPTGGQDEWEEAAKLRRPRSALGPSQGARTGMSSHQRSLRVWRNRRSPPLQLMQLGCKCPIRLVVPKVIRS